MADHNARVEIVITQGEDFTAKVEWVDDYQRPIPLDTGTQWARMDVKGAGATPLIRCQNQQIPATVTPSTPPYPGYLQISPTSGVVNIFIPYQTTELLPPGGYGFDLFIDYNATQSGTGRDRLRKVLLTGLVTVRSKITSFQ
jgi:hypothetical protein